MGTPHKATPGQWVRTRNWAAEGDGVIPSCLVELADRVKALEANQPHQQDKLDRLIALDRSDPAPAPAGGLMQAVGAAICSTADCGDTPLNWAPEARAAILAVAGWLDNGAPMACPFAARWLREEVKRHG